MLGCGNPAVTRGGRYSAGFRGIARLRLREVVVLGSSVRMPSKCDKRSERENKRSGEDEEEEDESEVRVAILRRSNIVDQLFTKQKMLTEKEETIAAREKDLASATRALEESKSVLEKEKKLFQAQLLHVNRHDEMLRGRVTINMGGTHFETSVETLRQCQFFRAMFSGSWDCSAGAETPIFIDRDPARFAILLNFLRSNLHTACLKEYCLSASRLEVLFLLREAEFFAIESAVDFLEQFARHAEEVEKAFDEIRVNVGGEIFVTSTRTLALCPFFANLLAGFTKRGDLPISAARLSSARPIFLDRNPAFFRILLDYLRSGCDRDVLKYHISQLPDAMVSYFKDDMKNFYELP